MTIDRVIEARAFHSRIDITAKAAARIEKNKFGRNKQSAGPTVAREIASKKKVKVARVASTDSERIDANPMDDDHVPEGKARVGIDRTDRETRDGADPQPLRRTQLKLMTDLADMGYRDIRDWV